jgi:hypothetical protein
MTPPGQPGRHFLVQWLDFERLDPCSLSEHRIFPKTGPAFQSEALILLNGNAVIVDLEFDAFGFRFLLINVNAKRNYHDGERAYDHIKRIPVQRRALPSNGLVITLASRAG